MLKVVNNIIRSSCHWAIAGGFLLLVLFGGVLLRLSLQPYSLTPYLNAIEEWLEFDGYQVRLDDLSIAFDGSLRLSGKGVLVETPEGSPLTTAHKVEMVFSNQGWLQVRPSLKSVVLDGASIEVAIYDEAIIFDRFYIPLLRDDKEEGVRSEPAPSLVGMLNGLQLPMLLERLESVKLSQMLVRANIYRQTPEAEEAPAERPVWRFRNTNIDLNRENGLTGIALKANMEAEDVRTPIFMRLAHQHQAETISMELGIDNPRPEVLNPLLPQALRDMLHGQVSVAFYGQIDGENKLTSPRFDLSFTEGRLQLPQVYESPIPFKQARIEGWYETEADILRLNYINITHPSGIMVSGSGTFADLKERIETNLEVQIPEGGLRDIFTLVPDKIIPNTLSWLRQTMDEDTTDIADVHVLLRGPLRQMPFVGAENLNRLEINAAFKNLHFVPLKKLPTIVADGRMRLVNDTLWVEADKAKLSTQNLNNTRVKVTGMGAQQTPHLNIQTEASGDLVDLVDIISKQVGTSIELKNLSGTHQLEGTFDLDLSGDVSFDDAIFDVVASIAELKLDTPYVGFPLVADVAAMRVTDTELDFHAQGTLSGQAANLRWHEKLKDFGHQTEASVRFDPDEERRTLMADYGMKAEGELPTSLNLKRLDAETVEFDVQSNLTAATFGMQHFGWTKEPEVEANLEARGRIAIDGKNLWVDWLSMRGPELEVLGSAAIPIGNVRGLNVQLNPFKIGNTDAFVDYSDDKLVLMGPSLDLSHWPKGDDKDDELEIEQIDVDAKLQSLKLRSGEVKDFEMTLQRRAHAWTEANIRAEFAGKAKGNLNLVLAPAPESGNLRLSVISNNGGATLKFFGISDNLVGGTLGVGVNILEQHGMWDWVANGRIDMGEVHLVRAPLLAQLLSLLSIQQLLSREEGILFREVEGKFKLDRQLLTLSSLRLSGPSLGMMFKGAVNFAGNSLNMEGKLIPAEGINRFVGTIPIIGTLVSGSQNALVAADFTIRGKLDKPEINANPLSVITPGIIKDIFGTIFGGDKQPAPENP